MAKSADAFRTISEVADWLGSPAHVLRFWESRFTQVKPVKRAGGRRYYRPDDMLLLGGIKKLLHDDGMTIKGVQKILKEDGIKKVAAMSHPLDSVTDDAEPDVLTEAPTPPKPAFIREEPVAAADDAIESDPMPAPVATEPVAELPIEPAPAADEGFDLDNDIDSFISEAKDEPQVSAPVETLAEPAPIETPIEPAPAEMLLDPAPIETPPETIVALDDSDPAPEPEIITPEIEPAIEPAIEPEIEAEAVVNPVYSPQDHTPAPVIQPEPEPEPAPKPALITTPPDPSDDDILESGSAPDLPIARIDRSTLDTDAIAQLNSVYTRLSALRDRIKSELGPNQNR